MTWKKREPTANLVVLGDDEGHVKKVAGLLASTRQDDRYPSRLQYELVQQSGESIWLAGSASIDNQMGPGDVGKFVKLQFLGWGSAARGKFKQIEVIVWDGPPTAKMSAWPRWVELYNLKHGIEEESAAAAAVEEDVEDAEDTDDLPFSDGL